MYFNKFVVEIYRKIVILTSFDLKHQNEIAIEFSNIMTVKSDLKRACV